MCDILGESEALRRGGSWPGCAEGAEQGRAGQGQGWGRAGARPQRNMFCSVNIEYFVCSGDGQPLL